MTNQAHALTTLNRKAADTRRAANLAALLGNGQATTRLNRRAAKLARRACRLALALDRRAT